uniref:MYB-related transcription factor n=1 Tax=Salvia miltiorrhiza TaxID=226208 RepID=A0A059PRL6_SALMI|nr:MYB-related transcription factor [Salvia miltiorrhiza]AGN52240.1 MYB-related transcription factor [Salvia miltiorrhiza]
MQLPTKCMCVAPLFHPPLASLMEGQVPYSLYPILESSDALFSSPYQLPITNPLNSHSGVDQVLTKQNEKETCYKGHWTTSQDRKLRTLVSRFGYNWSKVGRLMAPRIGKQCRERWHNNLRPPISKNIVWSDEEEMIMIEGQKRFGNRWSRIARLTPGRSENDVKNKWNKTLRRQFSSKNISTLVQNYILMNTPPPISTTTPSPLTFNQPNINAPFSFFTPPPNPNDYVTDLPLSVDDYVIDAAIPYFTFESAGDETSGNADLKMVTASEALSALNY